VARVDRPIVTALPEVSASDFPVLDRLEELEVPTLVLIGLSDPLVGEARVRAVFDRRDRVAAIAVSGAHALDSTRPDSVASPLAQG